MLRRCGRAFSDFEKQAEELSVKHNVKLEVGERNVGVFEATFEPSYTLHVRGTDAAVRDYAIELGKAWSQKAVVGFRTDSHGKDAELRYPPGDRPDAFYGALHRAMGDEAGATFDGDQWRVYIDGGNTDTVSRVLKETEKFPKPRLAHGNGMYEQLREGEG